MRLRNRSRRSGQSGRGRRWCFGVSEWRPACANWRGSAWAADRAAKVIDGPSSGDVAVKQRQCPRNVRLAQTGKPSGLAFRQVLRVAAHCLDEQQFRQLGQHRLRSRAAGRNLLRGVLKCRTDPFCGSALLDVELEQGWQGREHRIAFGAGAAEKATDHPRESSLAAVVDGE